MTILWDRGIYLKLNQFDITNTVDNQRSLGKLINNTERIEHGNNFTHSNLLSIYKRLIVGINYYTNWMKYHL